MEDVTMEDAFASTMDSISSMITACTLEDVFTGPSPGAQVAVGQQLRTGKTSMFRLPLAVSRPLKFVAKAGPSAPPGQLDQQGESWRYSAKYTDQTPPASPLANAGAQSEAWVGLNPSMQSPYSSPPATPRQKPVLFTADAPAAGSNPRPCHNRAPPLLRTPSPQKARSLSPIPSPIPEDLSPLDEVLDLDAEDSDTLPEPALKDTKPLQPAEANHKRQKVADFVEYDISAGIGPGDGAGVGPGDAAAIGDPAWAAGSDGFQGAIAATPASQPPSSVFDDDHCSGLSAASEGFPTDYVVGGKFIEHPRQNYAPVPFTNLSATRRLDYDEMAPSEVTTNELADVDGSSPLGPALGTIKVSRPYIPEIEIRRKLKSLGNSRAREDNYRLQGTQLLYSLQSAMNLPVKTYETACFVYHRFRLKHQDTEYNWQEVAQASLFVAGKAEDTHKKSREILCTSYNLRNPAHPTTPDDKAFEATSRLIVGLERHILEAMRFDFMARHPSRYLVKVVKAVLPQASYNQGAVREWFCKPYLMMMDLFMTFSPLKHVEYTCVVAVVQLASLVTGQYVAEFGAMHYKDWHTREEWVAEVMQDLLDFYTVDYRWTKMAAHVEHQTFIDAKIEINKKFAHLPRYWHQCISCERDVDQGLAPEPVSPGSPTRSDSSPAWSSSTIKRGPKGSDGTVRYVCDGDRVPVEKRKFDEIHVDKYEEEVVITEEPIDPRDNHHRDDRREPRGPRDPRGPRGPRGHGHPRGGLGRGRGGHGHGGRGGFDPSWHRGNRRRGGGGFY